MPEPSGKKSKAAYGQKNSERNFNPLRAIVAAKDFNRLAFATLSDYPNDGAAFLFYLYCKAVVVLALHRASPGHNTASLVPLPEALAGLQHDGYFWYDQAMAKLKKHGKSGNVVLKRASKAGRFMDIRIC